MPRFSARGAAATILEQTGKMRDRPPAPLKMKAPRPPATGITGMRTNRRRSTLGLPSIVVLPAEQPVLHRLASARARHRLTAEAAIVIRQRIAAGFYDSPAVADAIAR